MAAFFRLASESFDREPRRAVRVLKTPRSAAPVQLLSSVMKKFRRGESATDGNSEQHVLVLSGLESQGINASVLDRLMGRDECASHAWVLFCCVAPAKN